MQSPRLNRAVLGVAIVAFGWMESMESVVRRAKLYRVTFERFTAVVFLDARYRFAADDRGRFRQPFDGYLPHRSRPRGNLR